ncbi:hypothetical protein MNBD_UNCLBAC01-105 [hydrothermal vent metagenome]|uniref:Uncharacterized protein n=1 Tax=hydrothermal vent metagenome TaxID=652676 RepID=A0A3B1E2C2_9ZZZZ
MPRKKKFKISIAPAIIKFSLATVFALIIGFAIYRGVYHFCMHSSYFQIEAIEYDAALDFIHKRNLKKLKGKSIFAVDLKAIQRKLQAKYPQVTSLQVVRRFPNRIIINARQRLPLAQTKFENIILTLDEKGVVLSSTSKKGKKLPWIVGVKTNNKGFTLGRPLRSRTIWSALKIIKIFQEERALRPYQIKRIDVKNLSKIYLTLTNGVDIIVDTDKVEQKMQKLGVILPQDRVEFKEIKYIDLRFKEPILKKNN